MRLLGGIVCAGLLTVLSAAPAAADDTYDVPDDAVITVVGDGAGHGKGLSQYGAYGAARAPHNLSGQEILDFYYPGTDRGTRGGKVAVWISGDDDRDLVVRAQRGLSVRSLASGRTWQLRQPGADRWRLEPTASGTRVSYRTHRWHVARTFRGDGELFSGFGPLTLRTPDEEVRYRGTLRSVGSGADRRTVNVLPMEQYVRGVVPAEVSGIWPQQAMRAQAVASRTYAAYEREHSGSRSYDLCDTAACQAYGGASAETSTSTTAVRATAKQVLTYGGETAFAQYSASNGGHTVDGGEPYLPAKPDPYEGDSEDYYGWTRSITAEQVEDVYNIDNLTDLQIRVRDDNGPRGGRVTTVWLRNDDTDWEGTVTGDSFRRNFGLPSTLFELTAVS